MNKMTKKSALKPIRIEAKMERGFVKGNLVTAPSEPVENIDILGDGLVAEMVAGLLPKESDEAVIGFVGKKNRQGKKVGKVREKSASKKVKAKKGKKNKKSK
jgi:hypothetical protein